MALVKRDFSEGRCGHREKDIIFPRYGVSLSRTAARLTASIAYNEKQKDLSMLADVQYRTALYIWQRSAKKGLSGKG